MTQDINEIHREFDSTESALPKRQPAMRTVAMPSDTNASGDIFGGWLLSQMDLAGGSFASAYSGGKAVTVAIDAMTFHQPVSVGDEVSCYVDLVKTGKTSMTLHVETWARQRFGGKTVKVTEGKFVFVGIDENGKSRRLDKK